MQQKTITKEQFMAYRKVQSSGKYNMMTESVKAAQAAGLPHDVYMDIIWNYTALYNKYIKY